MPVAIKVENLSKIYRLGEIGTGTISRDMERWVRTKLLNQEDPFLKIGETNDRASKGESDIVYSLRDINFEIEQGDAVGIIGRNGAGKSTLLKILSRVTTPTTGRINIKGRVASLLEVGTGFHPELTGRENIYLNGAILGMRKREIDRKLEEIIDFSGVERYIDTPVKRYSSGMYVRLAFAVAAHLESEILIVDEVLAVGDAEFRKKCLGKMSTVSKAGRTVLFVSHEVSAVSSLCAKGVLIRDGRIMKIGDIDDVIGEYMNFLDNASTSLTWPNGERPGDDKVKLNSIRLIGSKSESLLMPTLEQDFGIEMEYEILQEKMRVNPGITLYTSSKQVLFVSMPESTLIESNSFRGLHRVKCIIPGHLLNNDTFLVRVNAHSFYPSKSHFDVQEAIVLKVIEQSVEIRKIDYKDKLHGPIRPNLAWSFS
jgi:lipopolysaccharide transport system ATP-binding protein